MGTLLVPVTLLLSALIAGAAPPATSPPPTPGHARTETIPSDSLLSARLGGLLHDWLAAHASSDTSSQVQTALQVMADDYMKLFRY